MGIWQSSKWHSSESCQCTTEATELDEMNLKVLNCGVEKTLESPLDCKEIKPVNTKQNQSWIFNGSTDVKAETPNTLATWCKEMTHWKRPWFWEGLKSGGEGDDRRWDSWMASATWWTRVWTSSRSGDGQGSRMCCGLWGHKESDTTEWLNWLNLKDIRQQKRSPQTRPQKP